MKYEKLEDLHLYNCDCMELMKKYDDNYFDLAIVDPPYGINESGQTNKSRSKLAKAKDYGSKKWDEKSPDIEYFKELKRISKNQIIWGANHFISKIPFDSSCWIVWDKNNGNNDFADCELAYTSFNTAVRKINFMWNGAMQGCDFNGKMQGNKLLNEKRIHPTQKPVKLYEWLLHNYAKEGDKIFDSHFGSLSIGIACHNYKYELTACELDEEYFNAAVERIKRHQKIMTLF